LRQKIWKEDPVWKHGKILLQNEEMTIRSKIIKEELQRENWENVH
jgi:hypothetical protein